MLMTSNLPRTYAGLLDDALIRYEGDFASEAFFNKLIAKHVFFGGYLYVNDGYLVNHPTARKHLLDDDSILREMIYAGFVRVFSRNPKQLATMPQDMADSGSRTFHELCRGPEWTSLRPIWELVSDYVNDTNQCHAWPKWDLSEGFVKIISKIWSTPVAQLGFTSVSDNELEELRNQFDKLSPLSGNPRDKYEKAAASLFGFDLERPAQNEVAVFQKMRQVMRPANECYHNNISMMQTVVEGDRGFAAETTLSPSADEIHDTHEIYRGQLDNIELMRLPKNFPYQEGSWFHPFLNHTHKVGQAKLRYIENLTKIVQATANKLSAEQLAAQKKELNESTREYDARISEHLQKHSGQSFVAEAFDASQENEILFSRQKDEKGSTAFVAGPNSGIVLALRDAAESSGRGIDFLMTKLKDVESVTENFAPDPYSVTFRDIRPFLASLAFNKHNAQKHVEGLKLHG